MATLSTGSKALPYINSHSWCFECKDNKPPDHDTVYDMDYDINKVIAKYI